MAAGTPDGTMPAAAPAIAPPAQPAGPAARASLGRSSEGRRRLSAPAAAAPAPQADASAPRRASPFVAVAPGQAAPRDRLMAVHAGRPSAPGLPMAGWKQPTASAT